MTYHTSFAAASKYDEWLNIAFSDVKGMWNSGSGETATTKWAIM